MTRRTGCQDVRFWNAVGPPLTLTAHLPMKAPMLQHVMLTRPDLESSSHDLADCLLLYCSSQ